MMTMRRARRPTSKSLAESNRGVRACGHASASQLAVPTRQHDVGLRKRRRHDKKLVSRTNPAENIHDFARALNDADDFATHF